MRNTDIHTERLDVTRMDGTPADLVHETHTGTSDTFDQQDFAPVDGLYRGSTYREVRDAMFDTRYQRVWGAAGEPALPVYDVKLGYLLRGALRGSAQHLFRQASARGVDSRADLRWGEDEAGFRRIVHPNGICLFGTWQITESTPYSGYFATNARGLIVARYSVCCGEPRRGHLRSLSMAGKIFPTTDPDHTQPLRTANFLTQQDIGGDYADYINDVEVLNAPNTTGIRRGFGLPALFVTGAVFAMVDQRPTIRQVYPIAELGKRPGEPTRAPEFMRLLVPRDQPRIPGEALDFRDEIMAQLYDRGDPVPRRKLRFEIEVSDEGKAFGPLAAQRREIKNWKPMGEIVFHEAVASYNGDFVLHFNHPTWRQDRDDPSTATRVDRKRVRGHHWLTEVLLGSKAP